MAFHSSQRPRILRGMSETHRKRRWYQFRLRTLLIGVLLLSLPLSWFAVRMERARAVQDVLRLGGTVGFRLVEVHWSERLPWVRGLLGEDFFDEPQLVSFQYNRITDADLVCIEDLITLDYLDLYGTQITDAGLEHIKGLANLKELDVRRTQVTPEGVKRLEEALPNCQIEY